MNDLSTAFAVPNIEGNARAEDVSKHSAVSRGEIVECGCEVVGRVGWVMLFQSRAGIDYGYSHLQIVQFILQPLCLQSLEQQMQFIIH